MAFLALTAGQTDADSPLDQTLFDLIRTNFDDHESRIGGNESLSDGAIRDDFVGTAIDTDTWDNTTDGTGSVAQDGQPDHFLHLAFGAGATSFAALHATTKRARLDLDRDHDFLMQARIKLNVNTDASLIFGLRSSAVTVTLANMSGAGTNDMIGFVRGTNANTLKFRTAKGGVAAETDNLGTTSGWTKLHMGIVSTGSGATIAVTVMVNDVEISGSPFVDETKIPIVELYPFFGIGFGATATQRADVDYCLAYWRARPLSN